MVWGISRNGIPDIPDTEDLKDEQQYCTKIKNKDYLWQNCGYGFTQQSDILNDFCIMFFN